MKKENTLSAKFKILTLTWLISLAMILWTIVKVNSEWVYRAKVISSEKNSITMEGYKEWDASANPVLSWSQWNILWYVGQGPLSWWDCSLITAKHGYNTLFYVNYARSGGADNHTDRNHYKYVCVFNKSVES